MLTKVIGLRYFIFDLQLSYRGDVEAQIGGLYNTIHGGGGQGDIGDEALRMFSSFIWAEAFFNSDGPYHCEIDTDY